MTSALDAMHRKLKTLLHQATGTSGFVVVVFLDVRGFSAWMNDPTESAFYLKGIYTRILDDYFGTASFFKPTGDGLLVVLDHDEDNLQEVVRDAVDKSVSLVEGFASLTVGDPMINFPTPDKLGIGIARGSATHLVSKRQTLDYSGRPLNLAARLMDLARPAGVVFDASLGVGLLSEDTAGRFTEEQVFVKGLAEDTSMTVHVLTDMVEVPEFNRYPIGRFKQQLDTKETTFKELRDLGLYHHTLSAEPADKEQVQVHVRYPRPRANGRRHPTLWQTGTYNAKFRYFAGKNVAELDYRPIVKEMVGEGVKNSWPVMVTVEYTVRDSGA